MRSEEDQTTVRVNKTEKAIWKMLIKQPEVAIPYFERLRSQHLNFTRSVGRTGFDVNKKQDKHREILKHNARTSPAPFHNKNRNCGLSVTARNRSREITSTLMSLK